MKQILILSIIVSIAVAFPNIKENFLKNQENLFGIFKRQFDKLYTNENDILNRFSIFQKNLELIFQNEEKDTSANYGTTIFSDLSPEEFESQFLTLNLENIDESEIPQQEEDTQLGVFDWLFQDQIEQQLPENFDWRSKGVVTDVKHQSSCGSCWAFTTAAILESQYAIKYGKLIEFSEQQLLDCDTINSGCGGGLMTDAYKFLARNDMGLQTREDYGEYLNEVGHCKYDSSKAKAKVLNYYQIKKDEKVIQQELFKSGPLAVGINGRYLQFYDGGVLNHPDCNSKINHAVLLVGWGVDESTGTKYWLIKNQWGDQWGDEGYFKLARDQNRCGINTYASVAFIE